ncbi:NfeD family protein [Patescibacteria group bacterium]
MFFPDAVQWAAMSGAEKVFLACAWPATVVVVLQLAMALIGIGHDVDADVSADAHDGGDTDHDGVGVSRFFTFKSIMAFFAGFGWTGATMIQSGFSEGLAIFVALVVGVVFASIILLVMWGVSQLSSTGTVQIEGALNQTGTVYLPISPSRQRSGQIQVSVNGSLRTYDAWTDDEIHLKTGEKITVISIMDGNTVVVTRS